MQKIGFYGNEGRSELQKYITIAWQPSEPCLTLRGLEWQYFWVSRSRGKPVTLMSIIWMDCVI